MAGRMTSVPVLVDERKRWTYRSVGRAEPFHDSLGQMRLAGTQITY